MSLIKTHIHNQMMTENTPDFSTIVENYAAFIIEGMDMKTL